MTEQSPAVSLPAFSFDLPPRKISWLEKTIGPEFYRIFRGVITNPLSVTGTVLIIFWFVVAGLAPLLVPPSNPVSPYMILRDGFGTTPKVPGTTWNLRPPAMSPILKPFMPNGWVHIMGTASGQWDIFYGVVWGARTAIKVGVIIEGISLLIGILIGSLAGFYGGWLDEVLMRITEVFMAFPFILAALTMSAVLTPTFGKGIWAPTIALITFGWMGYARLIRGDILSLRE
ncbi:MAG TPA: ABC transporter permease subunit, partial [Leptolinea sp.]